MKVNKTKNGHSITGLTQDEFELISDAFLFAAWHVTDTPAPLRDGRVNVAAVKGKERRAEQFNNFRRVLHGHDPISCTCSAPSVAPSHGCKVHGDRREP